MSKRSAKSIAKAQAAAQRSQQAAREKRNRIILLSGLAVVLILILSLVAYIATKAKTNAQPDNTIEGTKAAIGYAEPDTVDNGRAYWVRGDKLLSDDEITQASSQGANIVEYYFDFTCNGCNDFAKVHEKEIEKLAKDGKTVIAFRPSLSHGGRFAQIANSVLLWSYKNDPDKLLPLMREFSRLGYEHLTSEKYQNSSPDSMTQKLDVNPVPIVEQVLTAQGLDKKLAQIDDQVIPPGQAALADLSKLRAPALGIQPATPLILVNGTVVDLKDYAKKPTLISDALKK